MGQRFMKDFALILDVVCGITTLCQSFPVVGVEGCLRSLIQKYHLCERRNHGFVKGALFGNRGYVPWCTRLRIGKDKLVLPLFASPTRQGTLSLCFFFVVVEKLDEVFAEATYVVWTEAVLQNLTKVFCVGHLVWLVQAECSWWHFTNTFLNFHLKQVCQK